MALWVAGPCVTACTEDGAVMLASVLHSPSAVQMSVMVTRAFIAMRQAISTMLSINDALDQLRDTKVTLRKSIGFKTQKKRQIENIKEKICIFAP